MILKAQTSKGLQRISILCWIILFAIPLCNNMSANSESWLALCTQKGVQLISLSDLVQSKDNHEAQSCACSAELTLVVHSETLLQLQPAQVARDYYTFKLWLLGYRPQAPRAPPTA